MDCSPPASPVREILQARILEWNAMPSSRGASWSRDQTSFLHLLHCRQTFTHWARLMHSQPHPSMTRSPETWQQTAAWRPGGSRALASAMEPTTQSSSLLDVSACILPGPLTFQQFCEFLHPFCIAPNQNPWLIWTPSAVPNISIKPLFDLQYYVKPIFFSQPWRKQSTKYNDWRSL